MRTIIAATVVLLGLSTAAWAQQSQIPPTGKEADTVGVKGMPGNKSGPAVNPGQTSQSTQPNSSNVSQSAQGGAAAGADASGIAGKPGNKSGPAVNPNQSAQSNQNGTPNNQNPPLKFATVKSDLQKAGFTNIQLMNAAYLIQAKSKDGNTVVMMINPPNFSAVEAIRPHTPGYAQSPKTPHRLPHAQSELRSTQAGPRLRILWPPFSKGHAKMPTLFEAVKPNMKICSSGNIVGTVRHHDGKYRLKVRDMDGEDRVIYWKWVGRVIGGKLHLNVAGTDLFEKWRAIPNTHVPFL